jgi:hypothetical protein
MAKPQSPARADIGDYESCDKPVTPAQLRQLRRIGYRGAKPKTQREAQHLILQYRKGALS